MGETGRCQFGFFVFSLGAEPDTHHVAGGQSLLATSTRLSHRHLLLPFQHASRETHAFGILPVDLVAFYSPQSAVGSTSPALPKWHSVNEDAFAGFSGPT